MRGAVASSARGRRETGERGKLWCGAGLSAPAGERVRAPVAFFAGARRASGLASTWVGLRWRSRPRGRTGPMKGVRAGVG